MGLITPETGWLAARLMPAGQIIALALLGVAVALNRGQASDEEINAWYEAFSADRDPVYLLNHFYVQLEQDYPFLLGFLGALTGWTEQPNPEESALAVTAADVLKTIQWSETEPRAGGDLLGRVKNQMDAIGARRTRVFDYSDIVDAVVAAFEQGWGASGQPQSFIDAWCGSGQRVVGFARQTALVGWDPAKVAWRLNDPSPVAVAMAGLNMVGYQVGPDVKLMCNRDFAEAWASSTFEGNSRSYLRTLPPELAIDAPVLRKKRLGW